MNEEHENERPGFFHAVVAAVALAVFASIIVGGVSLLAAGLLSLQLVCR